MRVLFITNGYPTVNNPELCVFNKEQIDSIRGLGIDGKVMFINAYERGNIEYLKAIMKIRKKASGYDLIHCFHGLSFLTACLAGIKTPIVVSFLSVLENEYAELAKPLSTLLTKVTSGRLIRRHYGKIFKAGVPGLFQEDSLARYIPNGVNLKKFRFIQRKEAMRILGLDMARRYILFVSSKSLRRKVKRYDRFLDVLKILKSDPNYDDVEELVLVNEKRDYIPYYYAAASAHLLTSDYEGSPNSVKESLACGVPVIASNVGNVSEMISGLKGCDTVQPSDIAGYVAALKVSLSASGDADSYSLSYRGAIREMELEQNQVAEKIIKLYSDVLMTARAGSKGGREND